MNRIVYPREWLIAQVQQLLQARPAATTPAVTVPVGINCVGDDMELLVTAPRHRLRSEPAHRIEVRLTNDLLSARPEEMPSNLQGALHLGSGRNRGQARAWLRMERDNFEIVDELRLVGPGIARVALPGNLDGTPKPEGGNSSQRWSRTIGALGLDAFTRLSSLNVAIIGAGRTGSVIAQQLSRLGVPRLALVDPDRVSEHNCGEGVGFRPKDVGRAKAEVLAEYLGAECDGLEIEPLALSVTHVRAMNLLAASDLLIAAPDDNVARLAVAFTAALFLKPMMDIGTGIFGHGARREMGGDVRIFWPGSCVLCAGGLRDESTAFARLASAAAERQAREQQGDFTTQRAGSLSSLNSLMAAAAVRMLEDFVAGNLRENGCWLHLAYDPQGRVATSYPTTNSGSRLGRSCCCQFAGLGEDGIPAVVRELRARQLTSAASPTP